MVPVVSLSAVRTTLYTRTLGTSQTFVVRYPGGRTTLTMLRGVCCLCVLPCTRPRYSVSDNQSSVPSLFKLLFCFTSLAHVLLLDSVGTRRRVQGHAGCGR